MAKAKISERKKVIKKNNIEKTSSWIRLRDLLSSWTDFRISKDLFFELYKRNWDIRWCVRDIAKRVWFKWIYLEKNWKIVNDNEWILKLFESPTFRMFKVEFFKYLLIAWEVYITYKWNILDWITWLRFLDPRTMVKKYNPTTWEIEQFVQIVLWKPRVEFSKDELAYFQLEPDPFNEFEWLSLLEWVVYDAVTDSEATKRNLKFFENWMIPDWVIMLNPEFSEDELLTTKDRLESELKWTKNAHKMLISSTIKDVKTLSLNSRDIDFINQRKLTTEKICAVFIVPRSILGYIDDINRANWDISYKQYIEWTIRPFEQDFQNILIEVLKKFRPDKFLQLQKSWIEIKLDWESTEDRKFIEEWQREDIKLWIKSINEVRNERWYEPWKQKQANAPLIMTTITTLENNNDTQVK